MNDSTLEQGVDASLGSVLPGAGSAHRSVLGVGYMGVGIYKSWADGKTTMEYQAWKNMLERCYSARFQAKNPAYKGCSVASEWHNFQEFSQWLNRQKGWGNAGWVVDKDLLVEGNKVYCPDRCVIAPPQINTLFAGNKSVSGLPVGVWWNKKTGKYRVRCCKAGIQKHIGCYSCLEEAMSAYSNAKADAVVSLANEFKGSIDGRLYEALIGISKRLKGAS